MAWQATLHCGPHQVSWGEFSTAVSLLVKRFRESDPSLQDMGEVSSLAAYRLVQHTASIGRRGEEGHHTTSIGRRREEERGYKRMRILTRTLEELVTYSAAFEARYPQDTIYAILGLASDFEPLPNSSHGTIMNVADAIKQREDAGVRIVKGLASGNEQRFLDSNNNRGLNLLGFEVDYKLKPLDVYRRFLEATTHNSKSLDIICRPWAPVTKAVSEATANTISD